MDNRLKEMLEIRGLSESDLARMTGIPQPTLNRIINGRVNLETVSTRNFLRIAHALGLSAEALYFGDLRFDERKQMIDSAYALVPCDGRQAMLANAIGVLHIYRDGVGAGIPFLELAAGQGSEGTQAGLSSE